MRLIYLAVVVFASFYPIQSIAQKNTETQSLLWLQYSLKLKLNEDYQLKQEVEERIYWFPFRQHQFLLRTSVERKLGKGWNGALGLAYFIQSLPHNPETPILTNQSELRPQLGISYKQHISDKIALQHRYQSEFRFFEQTDGSFNFRNNRTRYKIEVKYAPSTKIALKVFDEIFLNIGKKIEQNVFDQNRYGASIQYAPFQNLGFELHYINWFQQRKSGIDFYQRHIIRLTVHHAINIGKKSNDIKDARQGKKAYAM